MESCLICSFHNLKSRELWGGVLGGNISVAIVDLSLKAIMQGDFRHVKDEHLNSPLNNFQEKKNAFSGKCNDFWLKEKSENKVYNSIL